jgi:hypothetical protein
MIAIHSFTAAFGEVFKADGLRIIATTPQTPRMNAVCERVMPHNYSSGRNPKFERHTHTAARVGVSVTPVLVPKRRILVLSWAFAMRSGSSAVLTDRHRRKSSMSSMVMTFVAMIPFTSVSHPASPRLRCWDRLEGGRLLSRMVGNHAGRTCGTVGRFRRVEPCAPVPWFHDRAAR